MTGQEILDNSFFAFWHILGEYFLIFIAFIIVICFVVGFIYILTKR